MQRDSNSSYGRRDAFTPNDRESHIEAAWRTDLEARMSDISCEVQSNCNAVKEFLRNQMELKEMLKSLLPPSLGNAAHQPDAVPGTGFVVPELNDRLPAEDPVVECTAAILARSRTPSTRSGDTHILTPPCSELGREESNIYSRVPQHVGAESTDVSENHAGSDASETCGHIDRHALAVHPSGQRNRHSAPTTAVAPTKDLNRLTECEPTTRASHEREWMPRNSEDPIACNKLCLVLHPQHVGVVVAEGVTGGSWRSKTMKFGALCAKGEQMVQIHRVLVTNVPVMHCGDRFGFSSIDEAVVSPSCKKTYIRWASNYLLKKEQISM